MQVLYAIHRIMRNHHGILVLFAALTSCLSAHEIPIHIMQANTGQIMSTRDKGKEGDVANLFETIRANAKLPPLTRIRHRDSLEQQVCTMANSGTLPKAHSGNLAPFCLTANPQMVSPELTVVASSNRQDADGKPAYPRYSVAVWRRKDSQSGEETYWVGVQRYWSALEEFVDNHFTDDVFYHDQWKKNVAPECRGK
jgi:hypothetical protein